MKWIESVKCEFIPQVSLTGSAFFYSTIGPIISIVWTFLISVCINQLLVIILLPFTTIKLRVGFVLRDAFWLVSSPLSWSPFTVSNDCTFWAVRDFSYSTPKLLSGVL